MSKTKVIKNFESNSQQMLFNIAIPILFAM